MATLKEISESIAAVRESLSHLEGSPGGHPDLVEGHFDILLTQMAEYIAAAERRGYGASAKVRGLAELLAKEGQ